MLNHKEVGEKGQRHTEIQTSGLRMKGFKNTLADAAVAVSASPVESGIIIVEDSTNGKGAVISAHNNAGTLVFTKLAGSNDITIAKDTAGDVNVYVEAGEIKVQNLTGAEAVISVKSYS